jgi:cell division protein FtsB
MNTFFFVVCIIAIVMTADTIQKIYKVRAQKEANGARADEAQQQLDALEERIRVLERIVTEDKHDLRREINRL